jgi:uncharacterized membrane protein YozB (DUF420 family)
MNLSSKMCTSSILANVSPKKWTFWNVNTNDLYLIYCFRHSLTKESGKHWKQTVDDSGKTLKKWTWTSVQINHQPDATIFQFIILTFIYSSTCFERSHAHHQEIKNCSSSLWFYLRIVVIAVLLFMIGPAGQTMNNSTAITTIRR